MTDHRDQLAQQLADRKAQMAANDRHLAQPGLDAEDEARLSADNLALATQVDQLRKALGR